MEEWFGGPIMEKLVSTGFEYLKHQARWQTGMKEELERLRENYPKIQAVVLVSSQAQITDQNPDLNKWLWQLRDAIDEADDVLDEFEYMKHENQLNENKEKTKLRSAMSSMKKGIVKIGKRALQIDPLLKKLEEVVKKLDRVSADVGNFLHLLESTKQEQQEQLIDLYKTRETGSLPKNDLIGRVKEKEFVMQWLRKPSNENETLSTSTTSYGSNISLLSIVGHGGMGKTTLLQHVYEDEITREFNLKMWVCVSNNFDVKRVFRDMLECLKMKKPDLESLEALQRSLKSEVIAKKFLLVLDDIWEESEEQDKSKWENVLAPLNYGSLGSKILATTRMDSVALMIAKVINKKKETFRLEGLEEDVCLHLLSNHAFANVENPDVYHPKLRSIAVEIVKKVYGSPLAAKVMGGILNSNLDERHWMKVLNSDIGNGEMGKNDIFPILRLSYMFLPKPLQNCFSFCGMFAEDHLFDKNDLVRMWIALGFIHTSNVRGGDTMKDIGIRYFEVLVQKSFFQTEDYGNYYTMHDLLHELAQSISAQECFRVMGDEKLLHTIPESIRHLSIETKNLDVLRKVTKFRKLRSLHLTYLVDDQDFICVLGEIFKASRSIRLLYIHALDLKMMPEAIKYLIHLRYLWLEFNLLRLPRSLSSLSIAIHVCDFFPRIILSHDFLPRDMNNLFNLHYLQLPWDHFPGLYGIGKLNSLEELDGFYVKKEEGYRIGELEYMNKLHQLRIKHVENVKEPKEACSAKLCDKKNLTDLSLEWGDAPYFRRERKILDPNLDEKVLDNLQPHNTLKKLSINAYMDAGSAIWMNKAHLISNLECIELDKCLEWETLPPFGQLPFLKSLYLHNMPKIKRLDSKFYGNDEDRVFPSLDVLRIEKLEAMEAWFDAAPTTYDCLFPCLTELYLKDCPNLQELPSLPPKLKKLKIDNIGWKALNWQRGTGNSCSTSKSIPLETLKVLRCPNIRSLPLAEETARLAALRKLTIVDCRNLISLRGLQGVEANENHELILNKLVISSPSVLQMVPLRSLTSLQKLEIKDNNDLVSFPVEAEQWFLQVSSSLHELNFESLKSLESLPTTLSSLSSLKILYVHEVPQLKLLPTIPISLVNLHLSFLESLQCLQPLSHSSLKHLYLGMIPLRNLPDLPSSLYRLSLHDLEKLDCLPSCLYNLSSLRTLFIHNVPLLWELQHLPPSLEELSVCGCQPAFKKRYQKLAGSDWHKISYISKILISTELPF
ncbi:LOW QUALITY PROTEIN: disease resistance protein RGA2-like [Phalaenopsis equestris]|uniref:LOW QUALITY PROTEIN: disease resistance protein RGA2-like n=1 Tax=Phalaenopsis equestris TaxID=78828 RepID=UPI0009E19DB4|nr:LOW QUALITY PROTEIN: disease resistance protein RGA2-like [Phalaenopsis equestris]